MRTKQIGTFEATAFSFTTGEQVTSLDSGVQLLKNSGVRTVIIFARDLPELTFEKTTRRLRELDWECKEYEIEEWTRIGLLEAMDLASQIVSLGIIPVDNCLMLFLENNIKVNHNPAAFRVTRHPNSEYEVCVHDFIPSQSTNILPKGALTLS